MSNIKGKVIAITGASSGIGEAIARAVQSLLAQPPPRAEVLRAAEPFSWEANAEALVGHWQGLGSA